MRDHQIASNSPKEFLKGFKDSRVRGFKENSKFKNKNLKIRYFISFHLTPRFLDHLNPFSYGIFLSHVLPRIISNRIKIIAGIKKYIKSSSYS